MKPLFKTNHSTTYTGEEENPVFNDVALVAAKNIQPDKTGLKNIYKSLREDKFAKSLLKQMSYLGSIKTSKKAKSSRENGKKGGRPLSGVSKTCLTCGNVFYIPKWRLNQNPNRGSYCSRECQGNPRIEINKVL